MKLRAFVLTVLLGIICALQVTPGAGVGIALAQSVDPCMSATTAVITCQTRENAWNRCVLKRDAVKSAHPTWSPACYYHSTGGGFYSCYVDHDSGTGCGGYGGIGGGSSGIYWATTCPAGGTWQDSTKTCFSSAACLAKPVVPLGTLNISVAGVKFCSSGCEFEAKNGTQSALTTGGGETLSVYTGGAYTPTGNPCSSGQGDPPADQPQQCVTDSSSTWPVCIKKTGEHCVKSKSGRQLCWKPFETGEKTDQDVLQVRNAGASAATPSTPAPPGESFTPGASVKETTTTTDAAGNARTVTTTTTNYTTAGGTNASGSGDAPSDSGETGDGTGSADSNSDYGSAGDGVGNLYTKKTDTLDTSFSDFSSQVQATPIVAAITGFFTFNETAACPIFTVPENEWVPEMVFDWFCTGVIADLLPLMGVLCLAAAAWLGFKIGVVW